MRRLWPPFLCGMLLLGLLRCGMATDVIDRIVATVNGHIILQSDWDDTLAYEAFLGGKPLQQLTEEDRKATLARMVDHELMRQQMPVNDSQFEPDGDTVNTRMQEVRKQSGAETDQAWRDLLARYNLSQDGLKEHVIFQIKILRLIDEHITPTVQVDEKSVEDYYNQTFLPQLREKGAKAPPLAEVSAKIHEILTQQKFNDAVKEWLQNLRDSSVIRFHAVSQSGSTK
jgi:hypothetical protein